ncbi:RluA family pseudouridine synthase [Blastopirellula marina]|nr:RluA family pseudouridine synthase [Blastopirellula marina]
MKYATPLVLYEDNHLLAISKPALLATMGAQEGEPSAAQWAKDYLKRTYNKPGNVYVGIVSRIDAHVTGVLLFARTSKAASRLSEQFRDRSTVKEYAALIPAGPKIRNGELVDWIRKEDRLHRMVIAAEGTADADRAEMEILEQQRRPNCQMLHLRLITGRKHQIRLQLASRGAPILGDKKYGSTDRYSPGIALHAHRLVFTHPTLKTMVTIEAPLPEAWRPYL